MASGASRNNYERVDSRLRVYLFGRFRLERGREPLRLSTRKAELLLAYLVLNPGSHPRERAAALFWGDSSDESARASLRNALAILRRQVDPDLLVTDRQMVKLGDDFSLWVDAVQFRSKARRFLESPSPDQSRVPLDLYTDDLLVDFYEDWVLVERRDIRALYLDALLELAQQMRSHAEYGDAKRFASLALHHDPANERAHQHLMFSHLALGNRVAALRQFESCRTAMEEELGVEPSDATYKLYDWIQRAPSERMPVEASITNLPIPSTTFVGRERELAVVKEMLKSNKLVTLTGAGGTGKTRLAVQVGTDLLGSFEDGVWWIELGSLTDTDLLPRTVAKTLGVSEVPSQSMVDTLASFVRRRSLLLVLDNCEHLVDSCASLVSDLLSKSQNLTILATSRERLVVDGEQVWRVDGLSRPELDQTPRVDHLAEYESLRLFADRAISVDPHFVWNEVNAPPVAHICAQLEGIPLAIELASANVTVLTPQQIADRLDNTFEILAASRRGSPERHQTLEATIEWSHNLLSGDERVLFRRLCVFAGGFTLAAVEAICMDSNLDQGSVVLVLTRLIDKSLLEAQSHGDEKRYRLLETIRQYSANRLAETNEGPWLRDRHLDYFRKRVEEPNPHLGFFLPDSDTDVWLPRVGADYANARAAVQYVLDQEEPSRSLAENGLVLTGNLHWYWLARGRFDEGRSWLTRLLDTSHRVSPEHRALGLLTAGYLACWQGDFVAGRPLLDGALALSQQLKDGHGVAFSLQGLGFAAMGEGDVLQSFSLFEKSLEEAGQVGDKWLMSFGEHWLGVTLEYMGEYSKAASHFDKGEALNTEIGGNRQGMAFTLLHHARIARIQGDYPSARSKFTEGMRLFKKSGDLRGVGYSLAGLAVLAAAQDDPSRAATLFGATDSIQDEVGSFLELPLRIEYDEHLAAVQKELGEDIFLAAHTEGATMRPDRAIEYALA